MIQNHSAPAYLGDAKIFYFALHVLTYLANPNIKSTAKVLVKKAHWKRYVSQSKLVK